MLKHIKPKDIIEFFLFGLVFVVIIVVAAFLESAPIATGLWVSAGLGFILWVAWLILVGKERYDNRPTLKVLLHGQWVDVDKVPAPAYNIMPAYTNPDEAVTIHKLFDQDDHENKEKA